MSLLEGLKKIIQGKPAETGSLQSNIKVYIESTTSKLNDGHMETYCRVKNDSDIAVLLDKIRLLGATREIDETLKPGDSKQVRVYSGEAPTNTGDNDAELQFRTEAGVYYKARHDVRFKPEGNLYTIDRLPYENTSQI